MTLTAAHASPDGVAQGALGLTGGSIQTPAKKPAPSKPPKSEQPVTMDQFLDRLMMAESGGRATAKNPRSTALGPFQFIKSTWIDVMKRHFPDIARKHDRTALLALRTDPKVARMAAGAYTRDLAGALQRADLKDSFVNLRLAYLLGPTAVTRVLQAKDTQPVSRLISPAALRANPFLRRLNVAGLKARAQRDLSLANDAALNLKLPPDSRKKRSGPRIRVRCNLARPSCKRWLALQKRKAAAKARRKARR
ncbi:MAG: hypothetical protein AAFV45_05470 [Pseudomonadota bacterium]